MKKDEDILPAESSRFEALGDGIFAVAMTILILDIHLPENVRIENKEDFFKAFLPILPNIICFFISFIILGIMWFGHRMMFEYISRINRYFIFLGVLFYMCICIVPFTTIFIASNPKGWYNILLYGTNLSMCNITLYAAWSLGISNKNLMHRTLPGEVKLHARILFLLSPVVYTIAIILGKWFPTASLCIFIITPVLYLLPNKLDKYLP